MENNTHWAAINMRSFVSVTVVFTLIAGVALYLMFRNDSRLLHDSRKISEKMHNQMTAQVIEMDLKDLFIDIQLIANHVEVRSFMKTKSAETRALVEEEFISMCQISKVYDQIRVLDNEGMELVRVNYNNGKPAAVPNSGLQNKANRYYFLESRFLRQGEVYASPFDLNVEQGKIEQPLKPMIRVATPIFDINGNKVGVVILNYLGQQVLDKVHGAEDEEMHTMLLNMDGYWLASVHKNQEWAFMYPKRKHISFAHLYPKAWEYIASHDSGQFLMQLGEITFSTIHVVPKEGGVKQHNVRRWKLLCLTHKDSILASVEPLYIHYSKIYLGVFILILFGALTRARFIYSRGISRQKLERARSEAEDANRAKSDFLARMSHEIRTPMNAIIGLTHLALKTDLTSKQRDYLDKISGSARSLLGIINDILDFSKIEAGRLTVEQVEFILDDVVNNVTNIVSLQAEQKGVELYFLVKSDVPNHLMGDPLRLGQVLINLLGNAIKFTEKGDVVFTAELVNQTDTEAQICFSIKDTGIGISEEQKAHLFQPFSQADGSITRRFGGTGLGLTICKRLIELMGGEMVLRSKLGKGTTVHFTLPFPLQQTGEAQIRCYPESLQNMRVLVVDDSKMSRLVLNKILTSFSFDVTVAVCATEGFELIEKYDETKPYQLLITDWRLPDYDGLELAKRVKNHPTLQNIPKMILITAYNHEEIRFQAEKEVDGFMFLPINRSVLFDSIMDIFGNDKKSCTALHAGLATEVVPDNIAGARVLLVEDNLINQQVARELLEGVDVEVTIVNDGQEALDTLAEAEFDVVLMDIQMPVMDGFKATEAIRADKKYVDLPIIAMTAHALAGDREKSLGVGMNDHITKPIDPDELFRVLSRWLEQDATTLKKGLIKPLPQDFVEQSHSSMPELPGVNSVMGLRRVRGNTALYQRLLESFAEDCAEKSLKIRDLQSDWKFEEARSVVHGLKGVAGNVGAERLHSHLVDMEKVLLGSRQINEDLWAQFATEQELVLSGIEQAFSAQEQATQVVSFAGDVDLQELVPQLISLEELLALHDVEAKRLLGEVYPALYGVVPEVAHDINNMVSRFEFSKAHEVVKKLLERAKKGADNE